MANLYFLPSLIIERFAIEIAFVRISLPTWIEQARTLNPPKAGGRVAAVVQV